MVHPDNMCIEKKENASKCPKSYTSCLIEVQQKELGLSSICCHNINAVVVISNNNFEGAKYHYNILMSRQRLSDEANFYELESDVMDGSVIPGISNYCTV